MYKREKPINLKGSTSALINNLTVSINPEKRQITYAVAHKSAVNLVTTQADGQTVAHKQIVCKEPSQAHGSSMVIQVRTRSRPIVTIKYPRHEIDLILSTKC